MEPAIKKLVIVLIAALIVVLGLIGIVISGQKDGTVASSEAAKSIPEMVQAEQHEAKTTAENKPDDEANASHADATTQAQGEQQLADEAQENDVYEGAIAGLSEEEIAKMALAEEQSAARTEETGSETAVD